MLLRDCPLITPVSCPGSGQLGHHPGSSSGLVDSVVGIGAMKRRVRVAVIDSGVNTAHPHIGTEVEGICLLPGDSGDYVDRLGHGTAVAAAIQERSPQSDLVIVKVFDRRLAASIDTLVAAIDWAARRNVDLINLSLGTANPRHGEVLKEAVGRATAVGALLVAAGSHAGVRYFPGSLEGVVSVGLDWGCPRLGVQVVGGSHPVFGASGYARPAPGLSPDQNLKGLSFAVANVTGLLARELTAGCRPSVTTAVERLSRL